MARTKRIAILVAIASLLLTGAGFVAAAGDDERQLKIESNRTPVDRSGPMTRKVDQAIETQGGADRAFGTIQYDTGTVGFIPGTGSLCFGNQFNTALGAPVTMSGTVTQVQFYMVGVGGTGGFLSMFGPVGGGTTASVISSAFVPMVTGFNTLPFVNGYPGPSFLLGVWADPSPISDLVGLDGGTTNGQGFHGMVINDIVGTGFSPITVNALVRPSGNIVVPVELMSFSVDGE